LQSRRRDPSQKLAKSERAALLSPLSLSAMTQREAKSKTGLRSELRVYMVETAPSFPGASDQRVSPVFAAPRAGLPAAAAATAGLDTAHSEMTREAGIPRPPVSRQALRTTKISR
jgi:hypothetical protein